MSDPPRYGQLLPSGTRAATQAPAAANVTNAPGAAALWFVLDVTAAPGAQTLQLQVYTDFPGVPERLLVAFPVTPVTTGTYYYVLAAGAVETIAQTTVEVLGLPPPPRWNVGVVHSAGGSWTYSLSYYAA